MINETTQSFSKTGWDAVITNPIVKNKWSR